MRARQFSSRTPIMALALYLLLVGASSALAEMPGRVDLAKIPRTILKEPEYQTESPGYCLLVFGLEAKTRVWLVVDGESVYLDRNGNGDLTEVGERVDQKYQQWCELGEVTEADGKTKHHQLSINVRKDSSFELRVGSYSKRRHVGGVESVRPRLAAKPADAPIIHPNGPITLAPFTPINFAFRWADESRDSQFEWLNLVAGSAGLGRGTFAAIYRVRRVGCDGDRKVLAKIEFPSREGIEPIISKQALMTEG